LSAEQLRIKECYFTQKQKVRTALKERTSLSLKSNKRLDSVVRTQWSEIPIQEESGYVTSRD